MELIFKNTIDDFVDAYLLVAKKNISANLSLYIAPRIGFPIVCFILIFYAVSIGDYTTAFTDFFIYLVCQVPLYFKPRYRKLFYRRYKRICSKKPYLLMEKRLSVKNNIINIKYPDLEKNISLDKIKHIIITDQNICLCTKFYYVKSIIPIEIFEDKNQLDNFLNEVSVNADVEDNYKK